jgi:hypothetical protein
MRAADLITKDAQHTVIMHAQQRGRDNSFETSQDPVRMQQERTRGSTETIQGSVTLGVVIRIPMRN